MAIRKFCPYIIKKNEIVLKIISFISLGKILKCGMTRPKGWIIFMVQYIVLNCFLREVRAH
jgi:hypothetical protein